MQSTSVVLPTYNEAETVAAVIAELRQHDPAEIVVVDDDSPDGTARTVRERFGDDDRVRVIVRRDRSGLSSAVLRGFAEAGGETLVCMDADGQHPPGQVPALVAAVEDGADVAVGSRFVRGGEIVADWPLDRRLLSAGAAYLARWEIPAARSLSDPMSGFFAVDAETLAAAHAPLRPQGFKILLEVLARCPVETVSELPITFRARAGGESTLGRKEMLAYIRHLLRASVPARATTTTEVSQ